jgi:hypothetical protein
MLDADFVREVDGILADGVGSTEQKETATAAEILGHEPRS